MASVPERFLPVEPVVRQLLQEAYPEVNTNPGSAVYDTFVLPASILYQRMRDVSRVMQRNQSLRNYNLMLPEELDRLAANFLVTRRDGTSASGVQRVYFDDVQEVNIALTANFSTEAGLIFNPVAEQRVTAVELAGSRLTDGRYYVDVPIQSQGVGSAYIADPGVINQVTGVVGASATENLARFTGGADEEGNSELYLRIKAALANRDLVKKDGIISTIQENFASVKSVLVQGFGDPKQQRDVITAAASLETIVPASYAQKVNLPLDGNGDVLWTEAVAAGSTSPVGGFVGAIYDTTGLDFTSIKVSLDGQDVQNICLQEGHLIRFTSPDDVDAARNDYRITKVEEVSVTNGGAPVRVARLDRPLLDVTPVGTKLDKTEYRVLGKVFSDDFHVGGKIDVYVDTTGEDTRTVTVNSVPAISATSDVGQIPLVLESLDDFGNSIFEGSVGFISPVITVTKVEQIDRINDDEVLRELIPGTHYSVVKADVRSKFSQTDDDLLVVRGTEQLLDPVSNQATGEELPLFVGQRLKVTYVTNPDINTIQTFVNTSSQRDVTKDITVLPAELVNVDVVLTYEGAPTEAQVSAMLENYIDQLTFDQPLCVSDIITALTFFGVTKVKAPVRLVARRSNGAGSTKFEESSDELIPALGELFRADSPLTITKL